MTIEVLYDCKVGKHGVNLTRESDHYTLSITTRGFCWTAGEVNAEIMAMLEECINSTRKEFANVRTRTGKE